MSPPRLSLAKAPTPRRQPASSASSIRAEDPDVRKSIEAIREWVEVRLGSRGDPTSAP